MAQGRKGDLPVGARQKFSRRMLSGRGFISNGLLGFLVVCPMLAADSKVPSSFEISFLFM
jgi:hypothetical protein